MENKIKGMIGIAMRAGALDIGEAKALERARAGKSHLLILATDASPNTAKRFESVASSKEIPLLRFSDKECLGQILGREFAVIVSVSNPEFAKQILLLNSSNPERKE